MENKEIQYRNWLFFWCFVYFLMLSGVSLLWFSRDGRVEATEILWAGLISLPGTGFLYFLSIYFLSPSLIATKIRPSLDTQLSKDWSVPEKGYSSLLCDKSKYVFGKEWMKQWVPKPLYANTKNQSEMGLFRFQFRPRGILEAHGFYLTRLDTEGKNGGNYRITPSSFSESAERGQFLVWAAIMAFPLMIVSGFIQYALYLRFKEKLEELREKDVISVAADVHIHPPEARDLVSEADLAEYLRVVKLAKCSRNIQMVRSGNKVTYIFSSPKIKMYLSGYQQEWVKLLTKVLGTDHRPHSANTQKVVGEQR